MSDDVDQPAVESFKELKARLKVEQADMSKDEVLREYGGVDLDNLPKQQHIWVKRGLKMSCEGAMHPHHSHFLINR
jgi:hypothetical protein